MNASLHHAHIFASDITATVTWWQTMLGAEVVFDGDFGGARNVFLRVGEGRLHIYDQWRNGLDKGPVHQLGVYWDELLKVVATMKSKGAVFRGDVREFENWRYIMCAAPDNLLLELFQVDADLMPPELATYLAGR